MKEDPTRVVLPSAFQDKLWVIRILVFDWYAHTPDRPRATTYWCIYLCLVRRTDSRRSM